MSKGCTDKWTREGLQFKQAIDDLVKKEVRIGFQAGKESESDGTDICDIAMWNELGTSTGIPARPFMRNSVDNNKPKLEALFKRANTQIASGTGAQEILDGLGVGMKGIMQKEIKDGDYVPNAPSTVARKGSDKPLIDTGRMRQSVNYIIREKGES